jgi:tetratricopeptide (TPR) repeat protein
MSYSSQTIILTKQIMGGRSFITETRGTHQVSKCEIGASTKCIVVRHAVDIIRCGVKKRYGLWRKNIRREGSHSIGIFWVDKIVATGKVLALLLCFSSSTAQLTTTPSGGNKKAMVGERIGLTDVTIHYDRPGVKKREGQIWGNLVPVGYSDQGFGNTKQAPWRAGANENTTIEFSGAVTIEGQPLAAGKYGFFIAYDPNECTVIFSKNNNSWGSFYYNPAEDALRVKVKPVRSEENVEWLKYEFTQQTENSAVIILQWEKLTIPVKVEVDVVTAQVASFRSELQTNKGFTWESWSQAAQWCAEHNTNLDQALLWADSATSINFGGDHSFQAWSTKAMVMDKMGRSPEAITIMKRVLPLGNKFELHQYARQLLGQKKNQDAFDVFKANYDKNPNEFTTNMGMARGYSALGNYKKALEFAQKAQVQAPDPVNKVNVEKVVKTLQEGRDIN